MKPILLSLILSVGLAQQALPDTITGTAWFGPGPFGGFGGFSFTSSNFSISGSGYGCGTIPHQIYPPEYSFDAMIGGGCGPDNGYPIYGSATIDGINYGNIGFTGPVDSWVSGAMTWDQYRSGGISTSPATVNVNLIGCTLMSRPPYECVGPALFKIQFGVTGISTVTWEHLGDCCDVAFQTTPEPASMALFAIGIIALGRFGHRCRRRLAKSAERIRRLDD